MILEGWLSIRAALISGSRDVYELLIEDGKRNPNLQKLIKRAKEKGIRVSFVAQKDLGTLTEGRSHGGAVARVGERKFVSLETLGEGPSAGFVAMLDGVEDPYNFGQAVRALHAAGAHGLIVRQRNWTSAAATVARASAGATEFMPMAVAEDDKALAETFKARGFSLVCTDVKGTPLYEANLRSPLLLIIGGERRGVRSSLASEADATISIPYGRTFKQALDTTSATAVIAFEVMRQRRYAS